MATRHAHHHSFDQWAHDAIQHDKRRPIILGALGLLGVAIVVFLMLYGFTQLAALS